MSLDQSTEPVHEDTMPRRAARALVVSLSLGAIGAAVLYGIPALQAWANSPPSTAGVGKTVNSATKDDRLASIGAGTQFWIYAPRGAKVIDPLLQSLEAEDGPMRGATYKPTFTIGGFPAVSAPYSTPNINTAYFSAFRADTPKMKVRLRNCLLGHDCSQPYAAFLDMLQKATAIEDIAMRLEIARRWIALWLDYDLKEAEGEKRLTLTQALEARSGTCLENAELTLFTARILGLTDDQAQGVILRKYKEGALAKEAHMVAMVRLRDKNWVIDYNNQPLPIANKNAPRQLNKDSLFKLINERSQIMDDATMINYTYGASLSTRDTFVPVDAYNATTFLSYISLFPDIIDNVVFPQGLRQAPRNVGDIEIPPYSNKLSDIYLAESTLSALAPRYRYHSGEAHYWWERPRKDVSRIDRSALALPSPINTEVSVAFKRHVAMTKPAIPSILNEANSPTGINYILSRGDLLSQQTKELLPSAEPK